MGLLSRMSRAATALTKYYIPYTWRNKPSIVSPVNEVNLNHIEDGINELDNRILILAQDKADAADVANVIIDFTMDDTTGVMTFTRFDGSTFTHDTAVEKIALNCYLEGDSFVLELADGTKQKVSLSKFIDTYTFSSTDTIRITANGKNISADIPDGKITLAKLEPTILSTIRQYTLDAQTAKGVAEQAASTAQGWAIGGTGFEGNNAKYYASKSQRYAVGGVEEGDAKDNAKAYCEAAKGYADQCAGVAEFDGTATSVSATDTHSLGSTNVQGQLDALADGLNNIDMSASSVTAVDTQGIAVNAGESSTVQALIDVIADKVMTKLLEKTAIVQVESTATNTVPSSAYFKQVKDDINSNLGNISDDINPLKSNYVSHINVNVLNKVNLVLWDANTADTPFKAGNTVYGNGFCITYSSGVEQWLCQLAMAVGDSHLFTRHQREGVWSGWTTIGSPSS